MLKIAKTHNIILHQVLHIIIFPHITQTNRIKQSCQLNSQWPYNFLMIQLQVHNKSKYTQTVSPHWCAATNIPNSLLPPNPAKHYQTNIPHVHIAFSVIHNLDKNFISLLCFFLPHIKHSIGSFTFSCGESGRRIKQRIVFSMSYRVVEVRSFWPKTTPRH
jgi:hypothetical protein